MMHLATIPSLVGGHLGGWRHPDAFDRSVMNLEAVVEMARTAERGKFDAVFLADGNGVREMERPALFAANFPSARPAMFEPTTLLSAVAMTTSRIGLVATATSTFEEPWMVARRFSSMDHISKGRAGWNLVTASNAGDALNFSRTEAVGREDRYARATEFYEVVTALWDSWAPDAFPQDKSSGRYLDPARVAPIDHRRPPFPGQGPAQPAAPRRRAGPSCSWPASPSPAWSWPPATPTPCSAPAAPSRTASQPMPTSRAAWPNTAATPTR